MAVGIIRARNLSISDIQSVHKHNNRDYESGQFPENIDEDGYRSTVITGSATDLMQALEDRLESNHVTGIRKNSTVAIEYVATINDSRVWDHYSHSGFSSNTQKFLEDRHGKGSVIAVYEHEDESNPHAHYVVVPLIEKDVKWKNAREEGSSRQVRLNAREFTGGRDKLRDLQQSFFEHLKGHYTNGQGYSKLGYPIYRGTLVENQTKEYVRSTDHEIGKMRAKLASLTNDRDRAREELRIQEKEAEKAEKELELKIIEKGKSADKSKWMEKGTKENKTKDIFHGPDKGAEMSM